MAPEQIKTPNAVDHRADIYSLGVVFYEMLTGELPLGRFAPPSQKSAADPRLDDVVLRALEKEPNHRTQSAGEVKTQVETIITNQLPPISDAPILPAEPKKFVRRGVRVGCWVFILTALFTTIVTFLLPEIYDAFARIKVEQNTTPGVYDPFYLQTQFEMIQSEAVLRSVNQDLKLVERWSLRKGGQRRLTLSETVALLKHSMAIRQVRGTSLIEIHFFSESSYEAAEIANAIAKSYAAYSQREARGVEIVDPATPPSRPVKPNKSWNIFLGLLVGIILGFASGSLTIFISRRLDHRRDSTRLLPMPKWAKNVAWLLFAVVALDIVRTIWIYSVHPTSLYLDSCKPSNFKIKKSSSR